MAKSMFSKIFLGILALLKVGLSTGIIIIVAVHLYTITIYKWAWSPEPLTYTTKCLMNGSVHDGDVCEYTYAVCGLSLLLTLIMSIFLCITCDLCGIGPWLEFIVEGFQTAWWIVASIVISNKVKETNDAVLSDGTDVPAENWRNAVAVMAWVNALLFAISAIVLLAECVKIVAKCCGCCGYKKEKEHRNEAPPQEGYPPQVAYPPQQPAPYVPPPPGQDVAAPANAV